MRLIRGSENNFERCRERGGQPSTTFAECLVFDLLKTPLGLNCLHQLADWSADFQTATQWCANKSADSLIMPPILAVYQAPCRRLFQQSSKPRHLSLPMASLA